MGKENTNKETTTLNTICVRKISVRSGSDSNACVPPGSHSLEFVCSGRCPHCRRCASQIVNRSMYTIHNAAKSTDHLKLPTSSKTVMWQRQNRQKVGCNWNDIKGHPNETKGNEYHAERIRVARQQAIVSNTGSMGMVICRGSDNVCGLVPQSIKTTFRISGERYRRGALK